jgi:hypothetical protein
MAEILLLVSSIERTMDLISVIHTSMETASVPETTLSLVSKIDADGTGQG